MLRKPITLDEAGPVSGRIAVAVAAIQGTISALGIALAVYLFTRSF